VEKTEVECAFCGRVGTVYQEANILPCFGVHFKYKHERECNDISNVSL